MIAPLPPLHYISRVGTLLQRRAINKRLDISLTDGTLSWQGGIDKISTEMGKRARRADRGEAMTDGVLHEQYSALEVLRHVLCGGSGCDWVGTGVDEKEGVLGFGRLEAWDMLLVESTDDIVKHGKLTREVLTLGRGNGDASAEQDVGLGVAPSTINTDLLNLTNDLDVFVYILDRITAGSIDGSDECEDFPGSGVSIVEWTGT